MEQSRPARCWPRRSALLSPLPGAALTLRAQPRCWRLRLLAVAALALPPPPARHFMLPAPPRSAPHRPWAPGQRHGPPARSFPQELVPLAVALLKINSFLSHGDFLSGSRSCPAEPLSDGVRGGLAGARSEAISGGLFEPR